jgi:sulfur relay (sulfurtransferase) DsrC/TusE family protein
MPKKPKRKSEKNERPTITRRLGVSFTAEDNNIIIRLRHFYENKYGTQYSSIAVIRKALRTQAEKEGIECD